jgi:Rod binding domain-containing protein
MQVSATQPQVQANSLPLSQLAGNPHVSQANKLAELARQFEATLLRQILTEAQKPIFSSRDGDSSTASIYRDMSTTQLAETISASDSLGVGHSLYLQLLRELPDKTEVPNP